ncbi:C-type lectin domain family 4 member E-like isoform X3 [Nelusetta ayraudi]|uniref:C-type lectin domain family 4 member E-like isoform X3 n=1 Tax=Nelusetta ayraudi TaxID=303726 RepID=UPI003F707B5F
MTEADVYTVVKYIISKGKKPGETFSSAEATDCEVESKQPSDSQKLAPSAGGSKITSERVALVILTALLTAAVVALIYISWDSFQTKESLHHMKDINRNVTERFDKMKETLDKASCPAGVNTTKPCPPCPKNWEEHGDQCYLFYELATTWELARQRCQQQGGDLVRIDSREEQRFLAERLKEKMKDHEDKFWIGLTDAQTEGQWLWVDGSPLNKSLKFWNNNEPDNWRERNREHGEDCAALGGISNYVNLANWYDQNCKDSHKSICEKPAVRGHLFCV